MNVCEFLCKIIPLRIQTLAFFLVCLDEAQALRYGDHLLAESHSMRFLDSLLLLGGGGNRDGSEQEPVKLTASAGRG